MAGLVSAIHVFMTGDKEDMDARAFASPKGLRPRRRDKPGQDGSEGARISCGRAVDERDVALTQGTSIFQVSPAKSAVR